MQAPDTQSTSIGSDPWAVPGRFHRESGFRGNRLVSHELRPAIIVVKLGNRRAEPWRVPSALRIPGPTIAASLRACAYSSSALSPPSCTTQSGLSSRMYGAAVDRTPWLTPVAKPSFVARSITRTHGNAALTPRRRLEVRLVIDHHDAPETCTRVLERGQAAAQFIVAAVVDDDEIDEGTRRILHAKTIIAEGVRLRARREPSPG